MRSDETVKASSLIRGDAERTDRLVTRREISHWAGVRRETVTTWAARHPDFPEPEVEGATECFRLARVLAWLEGRTVPERYLTNEEPHGTTYADRVRRTVEESPGHGIGTARATGGESESEGILTELFGPLAHRVRRGGPQASYLHLLISLMFLRHCVPASWAEVREDVRMALDEQSDPQRLLRVISRHTDEALRSRGLPPGMSTAIERLAVEAIDDLSHVVRLCEELGPNAFRALLDRFEAWTRSDGETFFTPRPVVDLVVKLLAEGLQGPARIHDPYMRGGELLAGMIEAGEQFTLSGTSPSGDALRLAGMNLMLNGGQARLRTGSAIPDNLPASPPATLIVTNPPFNNRTYPERDPSDEHWIFGPPPAHNDNYAWLQYILVSLAPEGRAGVLMPNRAAVSTDINEQLIRRRMIEEGTVEFIIALPRQLFTMTTVPVMLWGLRSPASPGGVLFIDLRRAGAKAGKQRVLSAAETRAVADCLHSWQAGNDDYADAMNGVGEVVAVSLAEIERQDNSLDPSDYLGAPMRNRDRRTSGVSIPRPAAVLTVRAAEARRSDERVESRALGYRAPTGEDAPTGWQRTRLHELCEIQTGPSHSLVKKAKRAPDGIPLVHPRHLRDRRIQADDSERREDAHTMMRFLLQRDDVLLVRTGSVGPVAIVTAAEEGWLPGTNLIRLRAHDNVHPSYLLALLSSLSAQMWITARAASATAIPSIGARTLGNLPVDLPPLDEQRRIGALVSDLDTQIRAHRVLADAAEEMRTDLTDELVTGLLTIHH